MEMLSARVPLSEMVSLIGAKVVGELPTSIRSLKPLDEAEETDLSFLDPSVKNFAELRSLAESSVAAALIVRDALPAFPGCQLLVQSPLVAVMTLTQSLSQSDSTSGIDPSARVHPSAEVHPSASIGAFCSVGPGCSVGAGSRVHPHVVLYPGARIGSNCELHSGCVIRENVELGNDCLIQNGAVIGSDGFGYVPDKAQGHRRIHHIGNVVCGDRVDVGANTAIDRGMLGSTRLEAAAKVDNLVQIGHNVKIGERAILCGQVGVSGSSEVGNDSILAGQVGVGDHIRIAPKVRVGAKSGVSNDIRSAGDYASGIPVMPIGTYRRVIAILRKLPDIVRRISALEK